MNHTNAVWRLWLDPSWLFLLAGAAVLFATIIIPVVDDATFAQRQATQASLMADHQARRVANYSDYLDALDRQDSTLFASLAADQLNITPTGRRVILLEDPEIRAQRPIDIFGRIEPSRPTLPPGYEPVDSLLSQLARGERSRLFLLAGATMCLLFGLLPASERS